MNKEQDMSGMGANRPVYMGFDLEAKGKPVGPYSTQVEPAQTVEHTTQEELQPRNQVLEVRGYPKGGGVVHVGPGKYVDAITGKLLTYR